MSGLSNPELNAPDAAFLAGYLQVLIGWDARACVRIQQRGSAIGFFGSAATGCITFVALPLPHSHDEDGRDVTVSAGRLRDVLGDVTSPKEGHIRELRIPDPVTGPLELLDLPPLTNWEVNATAVASDVLEPLDVAVAEFKRRVPPGGLVSPAESQRVAEEIWSRPGWAGVPLRAIHTAKALGFLANATATVRSAKVPGWSRLATPSGQVFTPDSARNLALPLHVLN